MKAVIEDTFPDDNFWASYENLWKESMSRSVFQAPHFLRYLTGVYRGKTAIYKYYSAEGELKGAAFFRKEGNSFNLLSDVKSDHNFFIIPREFGPEEVKSFFTGFHEELKKRNWSLTLNNLAQWAPYYPIFEDTGRKSDLFWLGTDYSNCPVLEEESSDLISTNVDKSREHRVKTNKLIKEQGAVFEIFKEDEDLDAWVEQFCKYHVERWKGTSTPSKYYQEQSRNFLKECLKSWIQDGVLVRFSIKKGDQRIAFVIGLLEGDALIHHSTSYDAEYYKLSPGKVLTYLIIQWMKQMGLKKLDFGEGNEDYKFVYANKIYPLGRVFISSRSNYFFKMNAHLKKIRRAQLQNNPKLRKLYHETIWPAGQKVKSIFLPFIPINFF